MGCRSRSAGGRLGFRLRNRQHSEQSLQLLPHRLHDRHSLHVRHAEWKPFNELRHFSAIPGSRVVERIGRRREPRPQPTISRTTRQGGQDVPLGKLLRAAAVAALTVAFGRLRPGPAAAADPLPDVFEYLQQNQVTPASVRRCAEGLRPWRHDRPVLPQPLRSGLLGSTDDAVDNRPARRRSGPGLQRPRPRGRCGTDRRAEWLHRERRARHDVPPPVRLRLPEQPPGPRKFFYAKCGCFRMANPPQLDANGPPLPGETGVDYQELTSTVEYAFDRAVLRVRQPPGAVDQPGCERELGRAERPELRNQVRLRLHRADDPVVRVASDRAVGPHRRPAWGTATGGSSRDCYTSAR